MPDHSLYGVCIEQFTGLKYGRFERRHHEQVTSGKGSSAACGKTELANAFTDG
jgi:hypothetical protein